MVVKLIVTSDVPNNALLTVRNVYEKLKNILSSDSPPPVHEIDKALHITDCFADCGQLQLPST